MDETTINAVMWHFRITRSEAREYIRNSNESTLSELVRGYKDQCNKAFYCD